MDGRERFFTLNTGTDPPRSGHRTKPDTPQMFGERSQAQGGIFGLFCVGSGVGLGDPCVPVILQKQEAEMELGGTHSPL